MFYNVFSQLLGLLLLFSSSFCLLVYLERFLQVSCWFLSAIFEQVTLGKTSTTAITVTVVIREMVASFSGL